MKSPRLKTHALQSAWKVLKTTLLPPSRRRRRPRSRCRAWFPPLAAPLLREGELFDNTYRLIAPARGGRDGRGLRGHPCPSRRSLCDQAPAAEADGGLGGDRAVRPGGAHHLAAAAPQHRPGDRSQHHRRRDRIPGHGVPRRREPGAAAAARRGRSRSTSSSESSTRSRRGWPPPTPLASFTATSSRTTCSWCRSRDGKSSRSRSSTSGSRR